MATGLVAFIAMAHTPRAVPDVTRSLSRAWCRLVALRVRPRCGAGPAQRSAFNQQTLPVVVREVAKGAATQLSRF